MSSSWKKASKIAWYTRNTPDEQLSDDKLQIGCLQRIADATELMSKRYQELIDDRDRFKRRFELASKDASRWYRRCCALRGVITKLRKAVKP